MADRKSSETHFSLMVVSPSFSGMTLVARHKAVYSVLNDELNGGVHALCMNLYAPEEHNLHDPNAE